MARSRGEPFTTVRSEGALPRANFLRRIEEGDDDGSSVGTNGAYARIGVWDTNYGYPRIAARSEDRTRPSVPVLRTLVERFREIRLGRNHEPPFSMEGGLD